MDKLPRISLLLEESLAALMFLLAMVVVPYVALALEKVKP